MDKLYRAPVSHALALRFGLLALSLAALMGGMACAPRRQPAPSQAPAPGGPPPPDAVKPPPRDAPPPIQMKPMAKDAREKKLQAMPQAANLVPELVGERAFGLMAAQGPILPSDSKIGALEDLRGSGAATAAILGPARAFLDGLLAGKLATQAIAPARLDLISLMAEPVLKGQRPTVWRLGKLKMASEVGEASALAAFSLFYPGQEGQKGLWLLGELGLRQKDEAWFVESLSLDQDPASPGSGG